MPQTEKGEATQIIDRMTIEIMQQLEVQNTHISLPAELLWQSCCCYGRVGRDVICTKYNDQNNSQQVQPQRADPQDGMQDLSVDKHSRTRFF